MGLRSEARRLLDYFPAGLARLGLVERRKATEAFDLSVPVMVTGGLRVLLRLADFIFVGIALGELAIAGLEVGFQYYFIGFGLSLALTSGTISVVSRLQGAGERDRADLAVKQSLWLSLVVAVPMTVGAWFYAEPLVSVLTDDPDAIRYGADYLAFIMLSLVPRFWSMVAARALAGSADTRTPMYVRLLTLPTNVALNAVLIFGLGPFPRLGIVGAALGTVIANTVAAVVFFALLTSGQYAVGMRLGGRQVDVGLMAEIVRVATPLAGMRLLQTFSRFPFIFILGVLGAPVIAAYAVGRRVMLLALMPAWGYSTAASTLVGQAIGAGEDDEATDYGWQTLRIALVTQVLIAVVLVLGARPIATAFGIDDVSTAVQFILVFGLGTAGFSVARTMRGSLRGAGDTRWPLYGTAVGAWLVRIPLAMLALPADYVLALPALSVSVPLVDVVLAVPALSVSPGMGLGLPAVFVAILGDFYVRAVVNTGRFWTGKWRAIARESAVGAG